MNTNTNTAERRRTPAEEAGITNLNKGLATNPFRIADGLGAEAGGIYMHAELQPVDEKQHDLRLRLTPALIAAPEDDEQSMAREEMIAHCMEALESPSAFERGPAAQKLGRLKAEDAREELEELAEVDPDEDVRFYAHQSLAQLDMPHVSVEALADLHFSLITEGRTFAASTNSKGIARFKSVPAEAMAMLSVSLEPVYSAAAADAVAKPAITHILARSQEWFRAAGQAMVDRSPAGASAKHAAAAARGETTAKEKKKLREWHITDEENSFDLHAELISVGGRLVLEFTDRDGILDGRTVAFLFGGQQGEVVLRSEYGWAVGRYDDLGNLTQVPDAATLDVTILPNEGSSAGE